MRRHPTEVRCILKLGIWVGIALLKRLADRPPSFYLQHQNTQHTTHARYKSRSIHNMEFYKPYSSTVLSGSRAVNPLKVYKGVIERFPEYLECSVICTFPSNKDRRPDFDVSGLYMTRILETLCLWLFNELCREYEAHDVPGAESKCQSEMVLLRKLLEGKPFVGKWDDAADFLALLRWREANVAAAPNEVHESEKPACLVHVADRAVVCSVEVELQRRLTAFFAANDAVGPTGNNAVDLTGNGIVNLAGKEIIDLTGKEIIDLTDDNNDDGEAVTTSQPPTQPGIAVTASAVPRPDLQPALAADPMRTTSVPKMINVPAQPMMNSNSYNHPIVASNALPTEQHRMPTGHNSYGRPQQYYGTPLLQASQTPRHASTQPSFTHTAVAVPQDYGQPVGPSGMLPPAGLARSNGASEWPTGPPTGHTPSSIVQPTHRPQMSNDYGMYVHSQRYSGMPCAQARPVQPVQQPSRQEYDFTNNEIANMFARPPAHHQPYDLHGMQQGPSGRQQAAAPNYTAYPLAAQQLPSAHMQPGGHVYGSAFGGVPQHPGFDHLGAAAMPQYQAHMQQRPAGILQSHSLRTLGQTADVYREPTPTFMNAQHRPWRHVTALSNYDDGTFDSGMPDQDWTNNYGQHDHAGM